MLATIGKHLLFFLICVILGSALGGLASYMAVLDWDWIGFTNLNDNVVEIHGYSRPNVYVKTEDETWLECLVEVSNSNKSDCVVISSEELEQQYFPGPSDFPYLPIPPKAGRKIISYETYLSDMRDYAVIQVNVVVLEDGSLWAHLQVISIVTVVIVGFAIFLGALSGWIIGILIVVYRYRRETTR